MRVLAYDPFAPPPAEVACSDLDELVAASDVLTLHVPLTAENHHMVNGEFLGRAKPGAVLINCGRGGLLDLDAALAALESGQLSGVGLDVFEPEPPAHHPIFDHPGVSLTPHMMGLTRRGNGADLRRRRPGRRRRPRRPEAGRGGQPGLGARRGRPRLTPYPSDSSATRKVLQSMRLGLIGLGRIGAFHTNTLVGIPAIDSLVVTDLVPEKTKTIVERFGAQGVEGVDSVDALLGSGVDGVIIAAGTDAHTKLILA